MDTKPVLAEVGRLAHLNAQMFAVLFEILDDGKLVDLRIWIDLVSRSLQDAQKDDERKIEVFFHQSLLDTLTKTSLRKLRK